MSRRFGEVKGPGRMQSLTRSNPGPDPVTTATTLRQLDTEADAAPVLNDPDTQEREDKSAVPFEEKMGSVWQGNGSVPAAQQQTPPPGHASGMELDAATKPSLPSDPGPDISTSAGCGSQKDKNKARSVLDGRKYVPSKKAMIDPLKMDMSKPLLTPLTSSQMSLQCIECHIIFSDHKSKERHLKLNHPAEYEQCILKNSLFACYVCDRHFTNSTELMAHQKAHIEKKPFTCPICNQAFKKSSELTVHKKVHFGSDGYACTDCGKPCKTMTLLKYHRRTHTGERPYVCIECGKRFTMPKALQNHMSLHSEVGFEGTYTSFKVQRKKDDGTSLKYHCSICKAAFKSPKTRLHHIKTKHKVLLANGNSVPPGQQGKQSTPIITPISFGQAGLLQVEPNGPLQKVDANFDTEQICRLIESLGNVQKVNQVVILGQVPPNAPPLEVQQIPQVAEPVNLNLNPLQLDFMGMKQTEEPGSSNNQCDPMEQTIILEPITPDGQPETNPLFQGICSEVTISENIEIILDHSGKTETPSGELMHHGLQQTDIGVGQCNTMDHVVGQNEGDALAENLEKTFILELTPALTPTMELEQIQTVSQHEISSPIAEATSDIQKIPDQTVVLEQETSLTDQPMLHKVELEVAPLQEEHQELSSCPVVPQEPFTQTPNESESNVVEAVDLSNQEIYQDQVDNLDRTPLLQAEENSKNASEILKEVNIESQEQVKDSCETVDHLAEEQALPQQETKQTPQVSELPVNVMSAQELVKVRKRKPARAFFLQGYMQDLVGSMHKDDLHMSAQPVKRKRTKKSHLVVKFGPQDKEKKNKEKKPSPKCKKKQEDAITGKKHILEKKRGRKGKNGKKAEIAAPVTEETSSTEDLQMQPVKEAARKIKINKQKGGGKNLSPISERKVASTAGFKKKKQAKIIRKSTIKSAKGGKQKKKQIHKEMERPASPNIPGQHLPQDALLLLKGHKQPQLKVYKLDTSKSSGQTPSSPPGSQQSQCKKLNNTAGETTNNDLPEGKKKGRPKKNPQAFSILSSLKVTHKAPEVLPPKPETSRKRKASSKVETEGVITSKRALECKDCGETFSEVSSLQKHKTTVHVIESPGLTYTNGNVFEGVTCLDIYQLPKQRLNVGGNAAAPDWDTEPETGEITLEDREPSLSFPALIPSPSLPVPPSDIELNAHEDKGASETETNNPYETSADAHSPSDQVQNNETPQVRGHEKGEPVAPNHKEPRAETLKKLNSETQVRRSTDEDVKEDLLLQVDLVTVGEQSERDELAPLDDAEAQIVSQETCQSGSQSSWQESNEPESGLGLQTVSCSTQQMDIKEEEEEIPVQQRKGGGKAAVARTARRKRGKGKRNLNDALSVRGLAGDAPSETCLENAQPDCQVTYERYALSSDSEGNDQREAASMNSKAEAVPEPEANQPSSPEESPEEGGVEPKTATTSVEEVNEVQGPQGLKEQDRDQSPAVILEKIITSKHQTTTDIRKQNNRRQGWEAYSDDEDQASGSQDIKVEEHTSDSSATAAGSQNRLSAVVQPQHHRDIRTVFVKEESPLLFNETVASQVNKHIQWNIEPVNSESAASPLMESTETTKDCGITPELSTSQCIFYPVKEEENEVLLCGPQSGSEKTGTGISHNNMHTDLQEMEVHSDEERHCTHDYQNTRRGQLSEEEGSVANAEAEAETEWQRSTDLQDFLLQSSDEEDVCSLELSDPQLALEADVMAYFDKNPRNNARQQREKLSNSSNSSHPQTPREEDGTQEPINTFSKYLGWETWVDIANCTNARYNMSNPVTAREVAQFVGIHIAMGTLKFPSPNLYWKDLTKVPLIAEAMPLSRFLELARMLKFAPPTKNSSNHEAQEGTQGSECNIVQQDKDASCSNSMRQRGTLSDCCRPTTDPLRKVESLLQRFKAGCQLMKRDDDYAVDQYPLPLARKMRNNNPAFQCTAIIGFGGFLQHVHLKLGSSEKEDAVEQMVPGGSMVYLCKQELSTPAMLERLLVAGVHGAGRVGGARGQIGDEFVSSDGKLMLRRSHSGFILSTAGNGQRDLASLIDNFDKAQMSAQVNRDLQNLYPTPLTASAPTCWPQAVLWYLTDLSLINSWLLYRKNHSVAAPPLTLMAFRLEVSKALILSSGSDTQDAVPTQPPTENAHATSDAPNPTLVDHSPLPDAAMRYDGLGHWPEQLGEGEGGRCRFKDCRRTSRVLCLKCCVFLCISRNNNCFWNFHNQKSMGNMG